MEVIFQLTPLLIFSAATALLVLSLGIVATIHGKDEKVGRLFLFLVASAAAWMLSVIVRFGIVGSHELLLWSTRASYAAATWVAFLINFFAYSFLVKNKFKFPIWYMLSVTAAVSSFSLFSPGVISNELIIAGEQVNVFGDLFYVFGLFFTINVGWGLLNLFHKRTMVGNLERVQINFILFGVIVAAAISFTTNFLIPTLANTSATEPYGPLGLLVFVAFTAYAIARHHLFDIKIIATEVFTGALIVLLFLNIFSASSTLQRALNIGIFIGAVLFAWMLIRSVIFEVTSREKIAKLAKQLQGANEKLQQVDKVKTEFISIASHQLRTPLTIIKGYTSMALEGSFGRFTKQQHEVVDKLSQSANRWRFSIIKPFAMIITCHLHQSFGTNISEFTIS